MSAGRSRNRSLVTGLICLVASPAIIRSGVLMPILARLTWYGVPLPGALPTTPNGIDWYCRRYGIARNEFFERFNSRSRHLTPNFAHHVASAGK
jgi:hypothetical protein